MVKGRRKDLCGIPQTEYKGGNYLNDLQMLFSFSISGAGKGS